MKTAIRCLIVACCLFAGCAAKNAAAPGFVAVNAKTGVITHKASKFKFPAEVGAFKRVEDLHFYDETGNNFSAAYNLIAPDCQTACTVYVYPAEADESFNRKGGAPDSDAILKKHYAELKDTITSMYRARIFWDASYELERGSYAAKGKKAIFEFAMPEGGTALSHLYIFIYKDKFVKYRFTYPSDCNDQVRPEIEKFLHEFQWP